MDGFDQLGKVKIIMATNRPDTLDPALLRPGRLDRKIEIGLPNEAGRVEVLKIHASKIKHAEDIGMYLLRCYALLLATLLVFDTNASSSSAFRSV